VLRRLIAASFDIDARNTRGDTALILASASGDVASVTTLLQAGASRKMRNADGTAAQDAAAARGYAEVVALLKRR